MGFSGRLDASTAPTVANVRMNSSTATNGAADPGWSPKFFTCPPASWNATGAPKPAIETAQSVQARGVAIRLTPPLSFRERRATRAPARLFARALLLPEVVCHDRNGGAQART